MGLLQDHLNREANKQRPDVDTLISLDKILNSRNITFEEWKDSGSLVCRKSFEKEYPSEKLNYDCVDVLVYFGGVYIQMLKNQDYLVGLDTTTNTLDDAEKALWDKIADKLFKN
jgi:hypothetical protein